MKSEPKVLHILSGDLWAGKEYQVVTVLSGLVEFNQKVSVLLFNEGETASRCRTTGAEVSVIDERQGVLALIRAGKKGPPVNVIFAHGYKEAIVGLLLSWSFGAKLVTVHHGRVEDFTKFKSNLNDILSLAISNFFSSRVVFVSNELRGGLGFSKTRKAIVIHNGLMSLGTAEGVTSNEAGHVVVVGRLVSVKRIDLAIAAFERAAQKLPADVRLLIIGDGPERPALEELARRSGVSGRVSFLGFRIDAAGFIASARALLITSDNEGVPTVLLEAMSTGTPVISTAVGGIPEIAQLFSEYPVVLARRGDVEGLASGISQFASSGRECREIPEDVIEKFNRYFSSKRVAEESSKVVSNLLDGAVS